MHHKSLIAAAVVLAMGSVVVTPVAAWAAPRCFGRTATIVGSDRLRDPDELIGTPRADVIVARGGHDVVDGRGGNDLICGGDGFDSIRGGDGNDRIKGGKGTDDIRGGSGIDRMKGGPAPLDSIWGGRGDDRLFGGGGFRDSLIGGPGDDLMDGGPGLDLAEYFASPTSIEADLETDTAVGEGTDRILRIEGLVGSSFDDVLLGDDGSNLIVAEEGNDVVEARGSPLVAGGMGDLLDGGDGDDSLDGGEGGDVITFDDSPAPVDADLGEGTATGWGSDSLAGIEAIIGSDFNDTFTGDDGDNFIAGGFGDDVMDGGGGVDEVAYFDSFEPVVADLRSGTATGWGSDMLLGFENLTGSAHEDSLVGDDGPNLIGGGSGPDTVDGGSGDDVLFGDGGIDTADGGAGVDACDAETESNCELNPAAQAGRVGENSRIWRDIYHSASGAVPGVGVEPTWPRGASDF